MNETQRSLTEKQDFFPFVSGELLDEHRRSINQKVRDEIKQFMLVGRQRKSPEPATNDDPLQHSQTKYLHV